MTRQNQGSSGYPAIYRKVRDEIFRGEIGDFKEELGLGIAYSAPEEVHVRDKYGVTVFIYADQKGNLVYPKIYFPKHFLDMDAGHFDDWEGLLSPGNRVDPEGGFFRSFPGYDPSLVGLSHHLIAAPGSQGKIDAGYRWANKLIQTLAKEKDPVEDASTRARKRLRKALPGFEEESNNIPYRILIDPRAANHVGTYLDHKAEVDGTVDDAQFRSDFWLTLWNDDFEGSRLRIRVINYKVTYAQLTFFERLPNGVDAPKEGWVSFCGIGSPRRFEAKVKINHDYLVDNPGRAYQLGLEALHMVETAEWANRMVRAVKEDINK